MESCDSLLLATLNSLTANVDSVKELVRPSIWQNVLDVVCVLSFGLSVYAIIGFYRIEQKIKWVKKAKEFVKKCNEYDKLLKRKNVASDLPAKIKGTLETFKEEIPYEYLCKRFSLKRKIKSIDKPNCDLKILLNGIRIEFKNYI